MNVSLKEASDALDAIDAADREVRQVLWHRQAAPFLMAWGVIWMVCNAVTDLWPGRANLAWGIGVTTGTIFTATLIILQGRRRGARHPRTSASRASSSGRLGLLGLIVAGFFAATFTVLGPLSAQQGTAFISRCFAFAYMATGVWMGRRLFITGIVTATAILAGYHFVGEHFFLWMAVFAGGSLLLAGFWFRRI